MGTTWVRRSRWRNNGVVRQRTEGRLLLGKAIIAVWLAIAFVQQAFVMGDPEFIESSMTGAPMAGYF